MDDDPVTKILAALSGAFLIMTVSAQIAMWIFR
jgi:hypothetical protein